eukprot:1432462-Amphidinium_carterae.1
MNNQKRPCTKKQCVKHIKMVQPLITSSKSSADLSQAACNRHSIHKTETKAFHIQLRTTTY